MEEKKNLLSDSGAKIAQETTNKLISKNSRIEELLTSFNNNPRNSKVVEYLSRNNLFDVIGKSRHEMVHSKMIAELIGGRYFELSGKTTLLHFLDIVIERAKGQGVNIPQELRDAVLTRSLCIDAVTEKQTEYPLASYASNESIDKKHRLDVFLRYQLHKTLKTHGNNFIEIFIENKVLSKEHGQQTKIYYETCADGRKALQLFVYLSPISQRDLIDYNNVPADLKPMCVDATGTPVYVHISYQDIFDKIIGPLLQDEYMNIRDRVVLGEYANCLELPAMPDDDDLKLGAKELSILAISDDERRLLSNFISNPDNAQLLEIVVNHQLKRKFYSYDGIDCLSFDQALQAALLHHTKEHGELQSMIDFKDIFSAKNGGARFLIYSVKEMTDKLLYIPIHLYEYNGKAYKTITDALRVAIKDYISRKGKTTQDVISDFQGLNGRSKYHQHVFKDTNEPIENIIYYPTAFADLFIREKIADKVLYKINEILGDGYSIIPITSECYHELLLSGDDTLWESYDKNKFNSLQGTSYYYRKGTEGRIDDINPILFTHIEERPLNATEKKLLNNFYLNNRKLILSVMRILMENETDTEIYEQRKKEYKKLLS